MSREKIIASIDTSEMIISKYTQLEKDLISIDCIGEMTLKAEDTIGIDLNSIRSIGSFEMLGFFDEDNFIIEASIDGITWDNITIGTSFDTIDNIYARYIRVRALKNADVNLYEIEIYVEGNFNVEEAMEEIEILEYISNIFDKEENSNLGLEDIYKMYLKESNIQVLERWKKINGRCGMT